MRKLLLGLALLALTPALSAGQPVNAVQVTIYRQGVTTPAVAPLTFSLGQFQCGVPTTPPPSGIVDNPTQVRVPDPTTPSLDCLLTNPEVNSLLSQLGYDPVNVYIGRARYINSVGLGPESPDSNPFRQPGTTPSAAPAFLRWGRGQ